MGTQVNIKRDLLPKVWYSACKRTLVSTKNSDGKASVLVHTIVTLYNIGSIPLRSGEA